VVVGVDPHVCLESFWFFGRVPSSSKEAIHICPEHGGGVIQRKERIFSTLLQLSHSYDAASTAFSCHVLGPRKCASNKRR
jgi:hypothetical protein